MNLMCNIVWVNGFDMGNGKGDFVILNLSPTGSVGGDSEHYPAKQVYTDFGGNY